MIPAPLLPPHFTLKMSTKMYFPYYTFAFSFEEMNLGQHPRIALGMLLCSNSAVTDIG